MRAARTGAAVPAPRVAAAVAIALLVAGACSQHVTRVIVAPVQSPVSRVRVSGNATVFTEEPAAKFVCATFSDSEHIPNCGVRLSTCHCCTPLIVDFECWPTNGCVPVDVNDMFGNCIEVAPDTRSVSLRTIGLKIAKPPQFVEYMHALFPRDSLFRHQCDRSEHATRCTPMQRTSVKFMSPRDFVIGGGEEQ